MFCLQGSLIEFNYTIVCFEIINLQKVLYWSTENAVPASLWLVQCSHSRCLQLTAIQCTFWKHVWLRVRLLTLLGACINYGITDNLPWNSYQWISSGTALSKQATPVVLLWQSSQIMQLWLCCLLVCYFDLNISGIFLSEILILM